MKIFLLCNPSMLILFDSSWNLTDILIYLNLFLNTLRIRSIARYGKPQNFKNLMHLNSGRCSLVNILSFLNLSAEGPPKRLNSATIGIKIYWPKMMFECCPRIQIDALRPPLLIYALKTRTEISKYL